MNLTEKDLKICRKLPEHEWEQFDLLYTRRKTKEEIICLITEYDGQWFNLSDGNHFTAERLHSLYDDWFWIPHPHQIMELKEWDEHWALGWKENTTNRDEDGILFDLNWYVFNRLNNESKSEAPTAFSVCLQAIEPFLQKYRPLVDNGHAWGHPGSATHYHCVPCGLKAVLIDNYRWEYSRKNLECDKK